MICDGNSKRSQDYLGLSPVIDIAQDTHESYVNQLNSNVVSTIESCMIDIISNDENMGSVMLPVIESSNKTMALITGAESFNPIDTNQEDMIKCFEQDLRVPPESVASSHSIMVMNTVGCIKPLSNDLGSKTGVMVFADDSVKEFSKFSPSDIVEGNKDTVEDLGDERGKSISEESKENECGVLNIFNSTNGIISISNSNSFKDIKPVLISELNSDAIVSDGQCLKNDLKISKDPEPTVALDEKKKLMFEDKDLSIAETNLLKSKSENDNVLNTKPAYPKTTKMQVRKSIAEARKMREESELRERLRRLKTLEKWESLKGTSEDLDVLISRWRSVARAVLDELVLRFRDAGNTMGPKKMMSKLMDVPVSSATSFAVLGENFFSDCTSDSDCDDERSDDFDPLNRKRIRYDDCE